MKISSSRISSCRHCQFYSPEGRRGGHCRRLNVSVQGRWNACNLATPPFAATWKELESLELWKQNVLLQEEAVLVLESSMSADLFEDAQPDALPVVPSQSIS